MKKSKKPVFNIVPITRLTPKSITRLRTKYSENNYCPKCKCKLIRYETFVPRRNSTTTCWVVPGYLCSSCQCLYVENTYAVQGILTGNKHAKNFSLDGKFYWLATSTTDSLSLKKRETSERKAEQVQTSVVHPLSKGTPENSHDNNHDANSLFESIPSAAVLLTIEFFSQPGTEYVYIISNKPIQTRKKNILPYEHSIARELLTAAYYKGRHLCGVINDNRFKVIQKKEKDENPPLIPHEINIKPGAGYYDTHESNRNRLVDLLIYSPFTQRYELCKASYDKYDQKVYMDIRRFREFIYNYGYNYKETPIVFNQTRSAGLNFEEMNAESILKGFGYNVSQESNLSASARQGILTEIVDLGILNVYQVVRHLEFFITMHPKDKDVVARQKWEHDKQFISDYRVNPKRFLILK